jgi:tight adherence protein C
MNWVKPFALFAILVCTTIIGYELFTTLRQLTIAAWRHRRREASAASLSSMFPAIARHFVPVFKPLRKTMNEERLRWRLGRAGLDLTVSCEQVLALKCSIGLIVLLGSSRWFGPLGCLVFGVIGFYLPDRIIADRGDKRVDQIEAALPNAVELMFLLVESGLDFMSAVKRLIEWSPRGPLKDELTRFVVDAEDFVIPRAQALKALADRVGTADVSSFIGVLIQANALGTPISPVLRQQAESMRLERFQRAERAAGVASSRMTLPVMLCTFPAMLIVTLGPTALQFINGRLF